MKKYLGFGLLLLLIVVLYQMPPNPVGIFVAKDNSNTIDSLFIENEGVYKRVLYRKKDKKMLFTNTGKWKYDANKRRILFENFFPNDDQDLQIGYNFNSVLMTYSVPLEREWGRVVFDYDKTSAQYRYYKKFW